MIPKVQTEREVGPILDMFLEGLLTEAFRDDPQLSGPITTISREFPFKKPGIRQSTNIDWLMRNAEREQLIFVELKTADTSFDGEQSEIYRAKQEVIRTRGASFLVEDLRRAPGRFRRAWQVQSCPGERRGATTRMLSPPVARPSSST